MIDTEIDQGNRIVKKDITDHSYTIEGNTKGDRYFYSKAICKKAYEREVIVTMKLEYTDSKKEEVRAIICFFYSISDEYTWKDISIEWTK